MRRALPLAAALLLAVPAAAGAHVTLQPTSAPAGAYVVLAVRVPNERDDASTVKVDVQMPDGILSASTQPVPGWTAKVTTAKLDTPVKVEGPRVRLTAAEGEHAAATPAASSGGDGGGSDGLAIAALVVGALGLVVGGAGLLTARRAVASP